MKQLRSKVLLIFFCIFTTVLISSCSIISTEREHEDLSDSSRNLQLSLTIDHESKTVTRINSDQINGSFPEGFVYRFITNPVVIIEGTEHKLEDAFRDGLLTEDEIFYCMKLDAAQGVCQYTYVSDHGLTSHFFDYPEYSVIYINDVLEAPDGTQPLIRSLTLLPPDSEHYTSYIFYDENGKRYDTEDWGLTLSVASADSEKLTVKTEQIEGQQIGQLFLTHYIIANQDGWLDRIDENENQIAFFENLVPITMNGEGQLTIEFVDVYGSLPSGEYEIILYVEDIFDESAVHPLMEDFIENMPFIVSFEIP